MQDLFITANIDFTDYIRTTEERHVAVVEPFWVNLFAVMMYVLCIHTCNLVSKSSLHTYDHDWIGYSCRSNSMMRATSTRGNMKGGTLYQMKHSWEAQR